MRRDAFVEMQRCLRRAQEALPASTGGDVDLAHDVPPHVARSWDRCRAMCASHPIPTPLTGAELADLREGAHLLWRCAQPELDALGEYVHASGCVALLANENGLVLGTSDGGALCGTDWAEAARGTNAIGTALHEQGVLKVVGREHYLDAFQTHGGAAAPVVDGLGTLVGVLALWGPSAQIGTHALALVQMAAAQVEHRLLCRTNASERVHFHRRPSLLGTPQEGLLLVEDGRIAGINRAAVALLGGGMQAWLGRPVAQVLGENWLRLVGQPGLVSAPDDLPWAVTVDSERPPCIRPASRRNGLSHPRPQPAMRAAPAPEAAPKPAAVRLSQLRREAVALALKQHGGHIAPAARSLGVGRSTLYRWLQDEAAP
ncbi:MAG: GAF domain-containing protein [Proteobacteria bacterium]|nr:GAF domain-containing protein [Pseudomonadota bacterium]